MRLFVSTRAVRRLHEIQAYLSLEAGAPTALRVISRIQQSAEMLSDFPELGPEWQGGTTRALNVTGLPYRIHYRLRPGVVEIITVAHTSRIFPRLG